MRTAAIDPADLRRALDSHQFRLAFQPEFDLESSTVAAMEALARWSHPERGEIEPEQFIPAAAEHGLLEELTAWVLDTALTRAAEWAEALGSLQPVMRINFAIAQLLQRGFVTEFSCALERHGVAPGRVCVEITESTPLSDPLATASVVRELRALGTSVAIDDLASGYSALGSLRWLPVDVVKVDRTLVTGIDTDVRAVIILSAVVTAARELGLTLVAEGVENEREASVLLSLGCTHLQGNHLGPPMSGAELIEFLRTRSGLAAVGGAGDAPVRRRPSPRPR